MAASPEIPFGLMQQKKDAAVGTDFAEFLAWLAKATGLPIKAKPAATYEELDRIVASGEALLAWCNAKARHNISRLFVLGIMAGAFIAVGALLFTAVMTGVAMHFGLARLIAGFAFSIGLLLVCSTGAELSTGNCMLAAAVGNAKRTASACPAACRSSVIPPSIHGG